MRLHQTLLCLVQPHLSINEITYCDTWLVGLLLSSQLSHQTSCNGNLKVPIVELLSSTRLTFWVGARLKPTNTNTNHLSQRFAALHFSTRLFITLLLPSCSTICLFGVSLRARLILRIASQVRWRVREEGRASVLQLLFLLRIFLRHREIKETLTLQ